MKQLFSLRAGTAAAVLFLGLGSTLEGAVFQANGSTPGSIQTAVDNFRAALGANNGVGGAFASGRREINWDGVPDAFSAPNNLPGNFFNSNSPRGAVFSTAGTGFQVSGNAGIAPIRFDNINATYSGLFQAFSSQRLFTALGSNILTIDFFVPGTNIPAVVAGFGAVFSDVNVAGDTKYTLTLGNGANGGQFAIPTSPAGGLSFLGLTDPLGYSRIVIQSGNTALGGNQSNNGTDLVVMDDFIFGEPIATTPEPASVLLTAAGMALLVLKKGKHLSL